MATEYSVTVDVVAADPVDVDHAIDMLNRIEISSLHVDQRDVRRVGATFTHLADTVDRAIVDGIKRFTSVIPGEVTHASARTFEEVDRELELPAFPELVGPQEMASRLHVSRQRLYEVMKLPGFPAPIVQLALGPIWTADSVTHFLHTWRRKPGRPPKAAAKTMELMEALKASVEAAKQRGDAEPIESHRKTA